MIYLVIGKNMDTTIEWKDYVKRRHFPFALSTDLVADIQRCGSPMMTSGKYFYRLYTG